MECRLLLFLTIGTHCIEKIQVSGCG